MRTGKAAYSTQAPHLRASAKTDTAARACTHPRFHAGRRHGKCASPPAFALRTMTHPCLSCGACCASFRVDFSVHEYEDRGGRVPAGLADEITDYTCRMRGTDWARPRCAALVGKVGEKASCGIYEWRPSPCREFAAGSDACNRVRQRHGLPALESGLV